MKTMPDVVPTPAIVDARAKGTTRIRSIANLRMKECDLGAAVEEGSDFLVIRPHSLEGAEIHTCGDHRVDHGLAILGLTLETEASTPS